MCMQMNAAILRRGNFVLLKLLIISTDLWHLARIILVQRRGIRRNNLHSFRVLFLLLLGFFSPGSDLLVSSMQFNQHEHLRCKNPPGWSR